MQVCGTGNRRHPRIDHNEFGSVVTCLPNVMRQCRESLGDVGSGNDDHFRMLQVLPGIGNTIQTKGLFISGTGTDHAESTIVIEIGGFQGNPGKLTHHVALFIG